MTIRNAPSTCAVSVIIPMYNAEKYIAECLESILIQTLKNFEVIVVDDRSTDNSVKIVRRYMSKFRDRLKLFTMIKNSDRPALPRNKGLILSRGEYIFFMDNDDLMIPTALEELYTLAKNYDAEVVYCEKFYNADINLENVSLENNDEEEFWIKDFVDKPTMETDIFIERLKRIMARQFYSMPWTKFIKRDLLIENEITFPNINRDDDIWTYEILFCAKRFLRVPNAVYVWRNVENSITRINKTPTQHINFWLNSVILGTKIFDDIMGKYEFFRKNPEQRYALLNFFVKWGFWTPANIFPEFPDSAIYEAIKKEFGNFLGEHDSLVAALCMFIRMQQQIFKKISLEDQTRIEELEAQLKKSSIEIKN
ncbi:MAG: glycosyltransferase [Selenomonadaceae bacterium]|nr:glycosyltransferase [Selenomonadaceae bacterium]